MNYKKVTENIRSELKDYLIKSKLKSLILGVSGGIDSALVAVLAKPVCDELGIPLIGRSISIESNADGEEKRADAIGKSFCNNYMHIDMTDAYDAFKLSLEEFEGIENICPTTQTTNNLNKNIIKRKIRNGNIKSRLRMVYFYNLAHLHNGMVLGTDNLSESASYGCGFFTLFGDGAFDYGMVQNLWKTEVYGLANYIADDELTVDVDKEALRSCIVAIPGDGLGITDGGDMAQLHASSYDEVDNILQKYHNGDKSVITHPVIQRHLQNKFKANIPISIPREVVLKNAI